MHAEIAGLAVLVRLRSSVLRCLREQLRPIRYFELEFLGLFVAHEMQLNGLTDWGLRNGIHKVSAGMYGLPIHTRDYVARHQAGLFGGTTRFHMLDDDP